MLPAKDIGGDAGRLQFVEDRRGRIGTRVATAKDLNDAKAALVRRHEFGHEVDVKAGRWPRTVEQLAARDFGIPLREADYRIEEQLHRVYADLNNPPGQPPRILGPQDSGYDKSRVREELWAEAVRAYMTDPNYLKTVAPDVAETIRARVNNNPRLNSHIQFNAFAPVIPLPSAVGGLGGSNLDAASPSRPPRLSSKIGGLGGLGGYDLDAQLPYAGWWP